MKIYWNAAKTIFGTRKAEKWLDENSERLSFQATDIKTAKKEINGLLGNNRHLTNCFELHPDNVTWCNFLKDFTVKAEHKNWRWYVSSNQHYIVSPTGNIFCRFGYQGYNLWAEVTGLSYDEVYERGEYSPSKKIGQYVVKQVIDSFTGKIKALTVISPKNTQTFYLTRDDAQQAYLGLAVERDVVGLINGFEQEAISNLT